MGGESSRHCSVTLIKSSPSFLQTIYSALREMSERSHILPFNNTIRCVHLNHLNAGAAVTHARMAGNIKMREWRTGMVAAVVAAALKTKLVAVVAFNKPFILLRWFL